MAQLLVRNVPGKIVAKLKARAREHGRSVEEEHRRVLAETLNGKPKTSFKEHLLAMPNVGRDEDFRIPRGPARKVKL